MLFSHDTEHALQIVVDLVNSGPPATTTEHLPDLASLQRFVDLKRLSDARDLDADDLSATHRLRDRLHEVFRTADDKESAVRLINAIIAEARISPRLTDHDEWDWHVHFFAPGARLAEHLAAEGGIALAYVIAADELDRLRVCEAPDCSRVLVDLSRNRCRRYCDSRTCGNRMHVAAYRARQRESTAH
ncbi:CGNR zinc finger domain-containing protein [Actinoallomurus soli]|uniref:CGNR zinc finger domain-containing protein n=1 Tax=Actinoallomurus soli TaxID=2952535 RepID=UPI0020927831|nr:CGNR zinc finger domain-containing protein [Actinoallomurus soli]MCO5969952.1 CGNR zinc finger domain-containing protein [Actinoallomurus soli]